MLLRMAQGQPYGVRGTGRPMTDEVFPTMLDDPEAPEPSAKAWVLALTIMRGGRATTEDLVDGLEGEVDPTEVLGALRQLTDLNVVAVDGDKVTLVDHAAHWREFAVYLANALWKVADEATEFGPSYVVAQALEQTRLVT